MISILNHGLYLYYRLEFHSYNEGPLRFQILFGQVSNCGIIEGKVFPLLGNLELLVENVNGWQVRPPFAHGMWKILGFIGLVIPHHFFKIS